MRIEDEIEGLLARYRREAVLLHRPYPPHASPPVNSRLGGLPSLPEHHEWPRASDGRPLHFLAQIDCAEIAFPTPLPERGMLFFFGRDDEEQLWTFTPPAGDDCRVVYLLDAFAATPRRAPPADLAPIRGGYATDAWRDYLRKDETGPNVHVEWPVRLLKMDSWPDWSALPEVWEESERLFQRWRASFARPRWLRPSLPDPHYGDAFRSSYEAALERRRAAAMAAASGVAPQERDLGLPVQARMGQAIFDRTDDRGDPAWPEHWIYIHFFVRALLHRGQARHEPTSAQRADAAIAEAWLERSRGTALTESVDEAIRIEFRRWVEQLEWRADIPGLSVTARDQIFKSAVATVRTWAADPQHAAAIPAGTWAAVRDVFDSDEPWRGGFSQLLGHAPSSQQALAADEPAICLLNIASNHGLGWTFGDMGECTFWIMPEDLARRDFGKVWGTIEGH